MTRLVEMEFLAASDANQRAGTGDLAGMVKGRLPGLLRKPIQFHAGPIGYLREHLQQSLFDQLDVEPPPLDHPLLADDIPNLIVTPHSAWAGRQARQNAVDETVANIQAFLEGRPRNRVV